MDKSLPYYDIIMKLNKEDNHFDVVSLNHDFNYKMYQDGDEISWAKLESKVGEFDNVDEALTYFNNVFKPFKNELYKRMVFITYQNEIVATGTAWFKNNHQHFAVLHWISVDPTLQGQSLGKAIVLYVLNLFKKIEPNHDIYLHTQSWSYDAVGLYAKYGFKITLDKLINGQTNLDVLPVLKKVMHEDLYQLATSNLK